MGVVVHTLPPVYDQSSLVLILGTMPSPKSREYGFYYSHPQNRFWRVLSTLFQEPLPQNNAEKEALVRSHHIALWDVLASCEIQGAADASIRRPVANDLRPIFETAPIRAVLTTGEKGDAALPPILPSANRDGQRLFALPQRGELPRLYA